jgi:hypothetical protein
MFEIEIDKIPSRFERASKWDGQSALQRRKVIFHVAFRK